MTEVVGEDPRSLDQARGRGRGRGGLLSVAVGLGIFGLSTYGYLGLAGRALDPEVFAPLAVLWTLLNAVGIGLFLPFEQEMGRRTAARRAVGDGNGPVVRQGLAAAGVVLGGAAVLATVFWGQLAARLFEGHGSLVLLFVLAMAGMAASYVVRGLLSGHGRFGHYGAQLAVDGVLRVVGAGALLAAEVDGVVPFGIVLVVAPVMAVLVTTPRPSTVITPGREQVRAAAASALAILLGASVLSQLLANAGPVVVQLLATEGERVASGQFTAALVIARVPLFAFAAVQAVLLPGLAGLVGGGLVVEFARRVRFVGLVTVALGGLGTVAVWLLGAQLVPLLFGEGFGVTRGVITLIALSGALFMVAQVAAQALLALGSERWVLVGWGAGLIGLLLALIPHGPVTERAAWALVIGSAVAMAVLVVTLVRERMSWQRGLVERTS
ncbi:lipopolysaccharide biosynthesis protein [Actinotalea sp. K2]|uniref:lipopolysaccharide biosynthesis protein n=1 Tax=Actinotalea sp. K2 TaxID=2939438 RepID=UPI00201737DE|nr:hypothetical protein [Actinotalea sp. K2]MCL3862703.1 hypothetical protein [Actinotalea sp. K2]